MGMGERIKELRISKDMTQEELGNLVGVQRAAVQKWESGSTKNLKRSVIEKLSNIFGVNPSCLMGMEELNTNKSEKLDKTFEYFIEKQMLLLGYEIIFDPKDAYVCLMGKEGTFEISEKQLVELSKNLKSFLNFKIHELMQSSRKIGKASKHAYPKLKAAHNDDNSVDQQKLMNEDLDDL